MSRLEHDLLGDREVPEAAYFGVHTLRAIENFPVTGIPLATHADLVTALAYVKHAAAQTNSELGLLDPQRAEAIIKACEEIRDGALHDQFVVDVIQGGAGTSTNMNANEVIANRALELLGHPRGSYQHLHPIDHVNLGQSTNDVYPTAIKVGLHAALARPLRSPPMPSRPDAPSPPLRSNAGCSVPNNSNAFCLRRTSVPSANVEPQGFYASRRKLSVSRHVTVTGSPVSG